MKFYHSYLSCDDFFNLCIQIFTILNAFGNFTLAEYVQTLAPLCSIRRKFSFRSHEHCSMKKTLRIQGKTFVVWYSHQCMLASHHSRCNFTANKIASLVLCKPIRIHFHHFTSSRPPLPEKTPKAMEDKGKQPLEENNFPPKKRTIRE
jgi:hypothetical protein